MGNCANASSNRHQEPVPNQNNPVMNSLYNTHPQQRPTSVYKRHANPSDDQVTSVVPSKAAVYIQKDSFKLEPLQDSVYQFEFRYNATSECILNIYFFARDVMDAQNITQYFYVEPRGLHSSLSFRVPAGNNVVFKSPSCVLNLSSVPRDLVYMSDSNIIPIVIELKPILEPNTPPQCFINYLTFEIKQARIQTRLLRQKLIINGQALEIHEMYGLSKNEGSECIICMTDQKDTVVMPCKHLCMCYTCANTLRERAGANCPVCRGRNFNVAVSSVMRVQVQENSSDVQP